MTTRIEIDYSLTSPFAPQDVAGAMVALFQSDPSAGGPEVLKVGQGAKPGQALVTLGWPLDAVGPDLPALVVAATDGFVGLTEIDGLQVVQMRLPEAFARPYPGPKFGIPGTRDRSGVSRRALVGATLRPGPGLDALETAERVTEFAEAGADIIVEDLIQPDSAHCPFDERVEEVTRVIMEHAEKTGKQVMYAFDVTGSIDDMRYRHDIVRDAGGTCIQIGLSAVGLSASIAMGRYTQLPLHGLARGWRQVMQNPLGGWSFDAYSALYRLAGVDHLHLGDMGQGRGGSVLAQAGSLLEPLFDYKACVPMPALRDGQGAPTPAAMLRQLGSADLIHLLPLDAEPEQVQRLKSAWDSAVMGAPALRALR